MLENYITTPDPLKRGYHRVILALTDDDPYNGY